MIEISRPIAAPNNSFSQPALKSVIERIVRWIIAILAIIVVAEVGFHLLVAPHLQVRRVIIRGDQPVNEQQLLELAGLDTGIYYGEVQPLQIEKRLAALASIKYVEVAKGFPNTVTIHIHARRPLGAILQGTGRDSQLMLFDDEGAVFTAQQPIPPDSLPVLSGVVGNEWKTGDNFAIPLQKLLQSIGDLRDQAPALYAELSEIIAVPLSDDYYEALLYFNSLHIPVRISSSVSAYQLQQIETVLNVLAQQRSIEISEIDFRSGEAVLNFGEESNG